MTEHPALEDLEGFDQQVERRALHNLASDVPADQAIVEIGTYTAKGTCYLAHGAMMGNGAHVWTVDPWDLFGERSTTGRGPRPEHPIDYTDPTIPEIARRQIKDMGYSDQVTFVQGFSIDIAEIWMGPPVGMLFIDGDHRESMVRQDFSAWESHLTHNAIVAWDDYRDEFPGVISVVKRLAGDKHLLTSIETVGSLAITRYQKNV